MSSGSNPEKILASNSNSANLIDRSGNKKPDVVFENLRWMTTREAASYLRVSVGQLRNLVCEKKVKAYKFLGRLRFLRSELDRLLKPSFL